MAPWQFSACRVKIFAAGADLRYRFRDEHVDGAAVRGW